MFSAVWLFWKSFSGKSFPVFGWSKHFTEIVLRWFVDRSGSSWIGALVRGSELGFVDRSGSERCSLWFVDRSWIGALVRGSELGFVDRSHNFLYSSLIGP